MWCLMCLIRYSFYIEYWKGKQMDSYTASGLIHHYMHGWKSNRGADMSKLYQSLRWYQTGTAWTDGLQVTAWFWLINQNQSAVCDQAAPSIFHGPFSRQEVNDWESSSYICTLAAIRRTTMSSPWGEFPFNGTSEQRARDEEHGKFERLKCDLTLLNGMRKLHGVCEQAETQNRTSPARLN